MYSREVWVARGWFSEKIEGLGLEDNVVVTGYVKEIELANLYRHCYAFIYPTWYEGFGLPVIEAMACGAKVACSNSSSLLEVGGKEIPYFNPKDIENMKNVIEKELKREDKKEDKQKRIDWANSFNWHKTSEQVKEAFALYK